MTQFIPNAVIVADNDIQMRGLIRSVLTHARLQVFQAVNGTEAVELARQFRPGLILLDIAMPNGNGMEACKAIRSLPDYAEVPIVMLTGYAHPRLVAAARQLGVNDFITKPFRPNALLARIAGFVAIPPHLLASNLSDGTPDLAANSIQWERPPPSGGPAGDNPELAKAREIMRIVRAVQR
jgi:CheY-like chemotaxis protein